MSTTGSALDGEARLKKLEEQFSQIEKLLKQVSEHPELVKRFDTLKQETETVLNKFADDSKKLQEALETLSKAQEETIKKLNIASDEIRSLGGKLIARQDPAPITEVKHDMGLSMFDLFED